MPSTMDCISRKGVSSMPRALRKVCRSLCAPPPAATMRREMRRADSSSSSEHPSAVNTSSSSPVDDETNWSVMGTPPTSQWSRSRSWARRGAAIPPPSLTGVAMTSFVRVPPRSRPSFTVAGARASSRSMAQLADMDGWRATAPRPSSSSEDAGAGAASADRRGVDDARRILSPGASISPRRASTRRWRRASGSPPSFDPADPARSRASPRGSPPPASGGDGGRAGPGERNAAAPDVSDVAASVSICA